MKIEFKQSQADYFNYVIQKYGGNWELSEGVIILQNEDDYFRIEHNNVTSGKLYTAWHKNHFHNKNDFHKQLSLHNLRKLFFRCATHKMRCKEKRCYKRSDYIQDMEDYRNFQKALK